MKKINVLLLCFTSLFTLTSFEIGDVIGPTINTGVVYEEGYISGPFDKAAEEASITYAYTWYTAMSSPEVIETLTIYKDSTNVMNVCHISNTAAHKIKYKSLNTVTHTFSPTNCFKNASCLYMVFTIKRTSDNYVLKTSTVLVLPQFNQTISNSYVGSAEFLLNHRTVDLTNISESFGERYSFKNYPSMFSSGTYHTLAISELKFNYDYHLNFSYSAALLKFEDPLNLFPYLKTIEYRYKYIPLNVFQNGTEISVVPQVMFVHPKTLEISPVRYSEFVQTNNFFFPVGTYEYYDSINFILDIKNVGINKANILITTPFYPTNTLIGDCTTSEYCIVGGVTNG